VVTRCFRYVKTYIYSFLYNWYGASLYLCVFTV